ncbi:lactonase family protein [Planctomycetota bacterium]
MVLHGADMCVVGAASALVLCLAGAFAGEDAAAGKMLVYVGGRAKGKGGGIHRYHLDLGSGKLTWIGVTQDVANPSFLAIHPGRRFLYAVNEVGRIRGKRTGAVSAFAIDPKTGGLTFLNQQPSGGPGPCHLVVDKTGKCVLAANYSGGSVCVLPVGGDGRLGKATAFVQHEGSSVDPRRQTAPHAHSINLSPDNRFAFAADLGLDKVLVYRFDAAKGTLAPNDPPFAKVAPGAGPRHFAFRPDGRFAYVINELSSTVTAFRYDAGKGVLAEIQTLTTLPKGFAGDSYTAEVQVHPSGKFLYGSNRGHNSIAVFAIDADTGKLRPAGHRSVQGDWPRHFGIDPTGAFLLAANRRTNNIVVFRIDPATGALKPTGHTVEVPAPVCVKMMRLAE